MYAAIATVANATVVKPAVPQRANGKSGRQIAVIRRLRRGKRRTSCGSLSAPALCLPRDGSRFPINHDADNCEHIRPAQVLRLWLSKPLDRSIRPTSALPQTPIPQETTGGSSKNYVFT
jgi:hypothetical protein